MFFKQETNYIAHHLIYIHLPTEMSYYHLYAYFMSSRFLGNGEAQIVNYNEQNAFFF